MIGLTEKQVVTRFGEPHGILDDGGAWNYQISKESGVLVFFAYGKVVDVSKADEWK